MSPDVSREILLAPEMDRILDALCDRQRRLLLLTLGRDGEGTVADMMMRGENDAGDVETELMHSHLPKLEGAGYIEWDRDTGEISKGPCFEEIRPLLDLIERHAHELPPDWP